MVTKPLWSLQAKETSIELSSLESTYCTKLLEKAYSRGLLNTFKALPVLQSQSWASSLHDCLFEVRA